jgi:cation transport ATPase
MLDKTGTITSGVPKVVRIEVIDELDKDDVLHVLYTLEKQSIHPLAKSITDHLNHSYMLENIKTTEVSGHGMEA